MSENNLTTYNVYLSKGGTYLKVSPKIGSHSANVAAILFKKECAVLAISSELLNQFSEEGRRALANSIDTSVQAKKRNGLGINMYGFLEFRDSWHALVFLRTNLKKNNSLKINYEYYSGSELPK